MSNITNIKVKQYIEGLYKPSCDFLAKLREDSETRAIPIITKDVEMLLETLIRIRNPRKLLEIGTAVGYSAIFFASINSDVKITTIEISEKMYTEALENINKARMSDRIDLIKGDASEILAEIDEAFDMIFIDAAKGHYRTFFDHCIKNSQPGTIIVSDNILYKGITASEEFLDNRRNKTIMRRMRDYLQYITGIDNINTSVLPVGDGVAISIVGEKRV